MTTRTWIRRLLARKPRTFRKDRISFRPRLERLENRLAPTVNILNNYNGFIGASAPDTCGAAGPDTYIETVNHSVSIKDKGTGTTLFAGSSDLSTFFFTVGGLVLGPNQFLADATSCYDEPIGRFVVADLQVTGSKGGAPSYLDLCVSTSSNPTTLTAFDWHFYQIETDESGLWSDYPGNLGYNQDALVVTFNMFDGNGFLEHSQVDALSQSDLQNQVAGNLLTKNQFDLDGQSYRPVTMHDPQGPAMWFVQDGNSGSGGNSINLVRIDNILLQSPNNANVHTFTVPVEAYSSPNAPLNPDGTVITGQDFTPDTRILKAAEANNTIVACQNVGVGSNEDDARWYEFNVSNADNPTLVDQGNVGFGANTYTTYPGIDINEAGDIGMSVIRSGTDTPTDYMSVYVTGRTAADAAADPGQMETPVLVAAGDANDNQGRIGDFSGINIDPNDGTFWTANEDCTLGGILLTPVSSTQITHFSLTDTGQASVSNGILQVEGSNADDNITLRPKPGNSSQTEVVDNSTVLGDFANSSFSSINVNLLGGTNTLTLTDTGGSSGLGFFAVPVTVEGGNGFNILSLDDSTSTSSHVYTLTGNTVSRDGFGGVTLTNVQDVDLGDGTGTNTVDVLSAPYGLTLDVNGKDSIYVGSNGSALGGNVQGITGGMYIFGSGAASLTVDDGGDSTGQTATLFGDTISGLAPATIQWVPTSSATGGVTGLTVYGGSGGNTFTVANTSNFYIATTLNTGTGNDTVNVNATTGALNVYNPGGQDSDYVGSNVPALGGNVQGINGAVNVTGAGATTLTVDDSGDTSARSATLSNGALTGLAPATISWTPTSNATGGVTGLTVYGGSGGNTFIVANTSNFPNNTATTLNTGTANDTVNVDGTTGALNVVNPDGQDSVYVGSNGSALLGNLQGINGAVNVSGAGATALTVDDSGDTIGRMATLSVGTLTGLAPATISWTPTSTATGGVTGLNVKGGSGGNTFNVAGTSNFYGITSLNTGTGNDTVNVEATTGTLGIGNPGGQDSVYVGSNGSALGGNVQNICGSVIVNGAGATSLTVDDGGDTTGHTATLSNSPFFGSFIGAVTGLAPAPIEWIPTSSATGGVTGLNVYGGSGGNTFNVAGTSNFYGITSLNTGTGNDTVNVYATTGALNVVNPGNFDVVYVSNNGSVQGINGAVNLSGAGGTSLVVNDSGDTTGRTVTLSDGALTGLASATISWTPTSNVRGGVNGLTVYGGSGGNSFVVTNTSNFYFGTQLNTGTGNDRVSVSGTTGGLNVNNPGGQDSVFIATVRVTVSGIVQGINGPVNVSGAGATYLAVNDSADPTGRSATLSVGTISGLSKGAITWTPTSNATGGVTGLAVYGGSGGNTFTVINTTNFFPSTTSFSATTLTAGYGNDTVNVEGTTGVLNVYNYGGQDSVFIGNNGSVQTINGAVNVSGLGGTALTVDDSNDPTTGLTATLSDGTLTGLAPATISWTPTSTATGGVTGLNVKGGSGGNTFTVTNTSNFYTATTLNTGTGNDTVNVNATTGALNVYNPGGQDSVNVNAQGINGGMNVSGAGTASLTVDDSADPRAQSALVTNSAVTGLGNAAPISYGSGVTALTVNGSRGASTYTVQSTQAGTATTVNAGAANDLFQVGDATHALSGIQGALSLSGGLGTNTDTFIDTAQSGNESYSLSTTALTGGGMAGVSFTGMQGLAFNAGTGTVSLAVTAVSPSLPVTYTGGGGNDTLQGPDSANTWQISGANAGTLDQVVSFSAIQNLTGGAASDTFQFQTSAGLAGELDGGGGTNTLDYSGYVGNITVDLPLALATGVAGGISNIQNVSGSQGNDLIVGDANPNVLVGGTGRNIIIGGDGGDTITGGGGDNLLIGGRTAYDTNLTALNAIFAEWTSSDSLATRRHDIRDGGGLNGSYYLDPVAHGTTPATVFNDSIADKLYDGSGLSWFFVSSPNEINNGNGPTPNDFLTIIH